MVDYLGFVYTLDNIEYIICRSCVLFGTLPGGPTESFNNPLYDVIPGQTSTQSPQTATPHVEGATGFDHSLAPVVQSSGADDINNKENEKYKEMLKGTTSPPPYSETDPAVIEGVVLDGK